MNQPVMIYSTPRGKLHIKLETLEILSMAFKDCKTTSWLNHTGWSHHFVVKPWKQHHYLLLQNKYIFSPNLRSRFITSLFAVALNVPLQTVMSSEDVTVSGISILAALNWSTVAMQAIKGPPGNWKLWTFLISPWVAAMPGGEILCVSVTACVLLEIERDERRRGAPEHQEGFFWARASLRRDGEGGAGRGRLVRPIGSAANKCNTWVLLPLRASQSEAVVSRRGRKRYEEQVQSYFLVCLTVLVLKIKTCSRKREG